MYYFVMPWADKSMAPVIAAALLLLLIGFVGGLIVGWIAHRDDNRRYEDSRRRYLDQQAQQPQELPESHARWDAERTVVQVYVAGLPQAYPQSQVIDAQILPALPARSDGAVR